MQTMKDQWNDSYLFGNNAGFIEELYDKYLEDPTQVADKWQVYFNNLVQLDKGKAKDVVQGVIKEKFINFTSQHQPLGVTINEVNNQAATLQAYILQLQDAYRLHGVEYANLDPLGLNDRNSSTRPKSLQLSNYPDLESAVDNEFYFSGVKLKLRDIVAKLEAIYCGKSGFEFAHIVDDLERKWLEDFVETKYQQFTLTDAEKINILQKLTEADGLERYLHTKYVGQKRFSLEGGDSLIPLLDRMLSQSVSAGVTEVYIGMAHRGRLNCLVNIAGKSPQKLIAEFEGNYPQADFVTSGDVKYHKGYRCAYTTSNGVLNTTILFNPSHLETVNPVLAGVVRAAQDNLAASDKAGVLGILVHGDSALIGLGTNQGVLNMSQTRAYGVGGIIHIVINNQVGFTTSDIRDTRSSRFCTDIMKMIDAPVIHVNGDDLTAVMFAVDLAVKYRTQFKKDIMLDLVCFRKYGHNEADDPTLTQPIMYRKIKAHLGIRKLYANLLIENKVIEPKAADDMAEDYRLGLNKGLHIVGNMQALSWYDFFAANLDKVKAASPFAVVATSISAQQITQITNVLTTKPDDEFMLHSTMAKLMDTRLAMGSGTQAVDYGMAEMLAYGSLLISGVNVRLVGEDSCRGTFSHRMAVMHDMNPAGLADRTYIPLQNLPNATGRFSLYDSVLNEECALGFEYGYGLRKLQDLVIWEGQFGDFANGAQVIIDQFIASGEVKWGILSNITLLLPHGYDGQGPEHSSARMERFLQLCAENNLQVVVPSTSAQMFHLLRRQALSNYIKPLVIFMSKKLLRYKDAACGLSEFTNGGFQLVIADNTTINPEKVSRILVCTGQIYYDLVSERKKQLQTDTVAIVRLEQLYPFPITQLHTELNKYKNPTIKYLWVQEEPHNQGAWEQIRDNLNAALNTKNREFIVIARSASAAPACGLPSLHNEQLQQILKQVFI